MVLTFPNLLLVIALVLFVLAGLNVAAGRFNLLAFGLAAWCASTFVAIVFR